MQPVIEASGLYSPQDAQFAGEWPQIGNHHQVWSVKKIFFTMYLYSIYTFLYSFIQYLYIFIQ